MKPTKVFDTNTDFYICVYLTASLSIVTVCDIITGKHERQGTYSTYVEACKAAKELAKQYTF